VPVTYINTPRMVDSFVRLAKMDTVSDPSKAETGPVPSTESQRAIAAVLKAELETLGLKNVTMDQSTVVTGFLPTNITPAPGETIPTIGLFSHFDLNCDAPTDNIQPTIHRNYPGGDLTLGHGTVIPAKDLAGHEGEDIITSDGRTLLGADDKAGIAEILEILRVYKEHPELKRPNIKVCFTPDEEIGRGMDFFDVKAFGADAAYTIDGSKPGEIESETFNAHQVTLIFKGKDVHPGYAKGIMVNSLRAMADFVTRLPRDEAPETTDGKQGYLHPYSGSVPSASETTLNVLVRDFDYENSLRRIEQLKVLAADVEKAHPGITVEVKVREQYRNMKFEVDKKPEVVAHAKEGIIATNLPVHDAPIRGGTDGSSLSLMGLPTPNLGAGGQNFHSVREFVTIQDMTKCAAVIINTMSAWAQKFIK
jgi:tripeptide aminopeptidase